MIEIKECPVCGATEQKTVRKAPFFRGEREWFTIASCQTCGFWFTSPRPELEKLGDYYEADNYVSHTDGGKSLFDQAYKMVRSYALKKKLGLVKNYAPIESNELVDYGAGSGAFLAYAQEKGIKVKGFEPSDIARKQAAKKGVTLLDPSERESMAVNSVGAFSLWHVLEHLPDLNESLQFFHSRLVDQGCLFLALPNHESHDAQHYGDFWAALDVPLHLWHFSKNDIEALAKKHSFRVEQVVNMPFDSFYVSLLSEKNKGGGNPISGLWHGLISNLKGRGKAKNMSSLIYILRKL